eukprot:13948-Heterococcus_DN1.PRE.8
MGVSRTARTVNDAGNSGEALEAAALAPARTHTSIVKAALLKRRHTLNLSYSGFPAFIEGTLMSKGDQLLLLSLAALLLLAAQKSERSHDLDTLSSDSASVPPGRIAKVLHWSEGVFRAAQQCSFCT